MNSRISGWSTSSTTILAARLVMPPDLVAPAALSSTSRKLINPLEVPPPERRSIFPRSLEKFVPLPEPYLKTRASSWTRLKIESRSSLQLWMKQADTCGRLYAFCVECALPVARSTAKFPPEPWILYSCQSPQLNQTGLL